jgi:hypothetical protein
MHFGTKNYLKNNRYHTAKHVLSLFNYYYYYLFKYCVFIPSLTKPSGSIIKIYKKII